MYIVLFRLLGWNSKSCEGHLAEVCFTKAKEEGLVIAINWQDADSSSAKSFRYVFLDSSPTRVMHCGGHVGLQRKEICRLVICGCSQEELSWAGNSKMWVCWEASPLKKSGNDPDEYARRMRILGKYHSCEIHEWTGDDGKTYGYPWHPIRVCCCGNCDGKERQTDSVDSEDSEAGSSG